jgi:hypothetical protein
LTPAPSRYERIIHGEAELAAVVAGTVVVGDAGMVIGADALGDGFGAPLVFVATSTGLGRIGAGRVGLGIMGGAEPVARGGSGAASDADGGGACAAGGGGGICTMGGGCT